MKKLVIVILLLVSSFAVYAQVSFEGIFLEGVTAKWEAATALDLTADNIVTTNSAHGTENTALSQVWGTAAISISSATVCDGTRSSMAGVNAPPKNMYFGPSVQLAAGTDYTLYYEMKLVDDTKDLKYILYENSTAGAVVQTEYGYFGTTDCTAFTINSTAVAAIGQFLINFTEREQAVTSSIALDSVYIIGNPGNNRTPNLQACTHLSYGAESQVGRSQWSASTGTFTYDSTFEHSGIVCLRLANMTVPCTVTMNLPVQINAGENFTFSYVNYEQATIYACTVDVYCNSTAGQKLINGNDPSGSGTQVSYSFTGVAAADTTALIFYVPWQAGGNGRLYIDTLAVYLN